MRIASHDPSQYNSNMPNTLEADVALIHIAAGSGRVAAPPGTLAQSAPRKAARGRASDLLFLNLSLYPDRTSAPGLTDHLAQLAAEAYFGTPGSITAGLRAAAAIVNDHLMDVNRQERGESRLLGRLMAGVLRGDDFYIAQCGPGQTSLIRTDLVSHQSSQEAADHPLGAAATPHIRYHHLNLHPGDLIILTTTEPPLWPDPILSQLAGMNPAQAMERLADISAKDLTGLLLRIAAPGSAHALPPLPEEPERSSLEWQSQDHSSVRKKRRKKTPKEPGAAPKTGVLRCIANGLRGGISGLFDLLSKALVRLAPGLAEPPTEPFSSRTLALISIAVPLVIVAIGIVIYIQKGYSQQFQLYLGEAMDAAALAETMGASPQSRDAWDKALANLDTAKRYGNSPEWEALHQKTQAALDALDLVVRLDFEAVLNGGFGAGTKLTAIAASPTDVYILDSAKPEIFHLWSTGRGFEADNDFRCLGEQGQTPMSPIVGLAIQPEPGALGREGVVALSETGELLYCAPDLTPATAKLTPPDTGWERIKAFTVIQESLYVLDSDANAIWVYDASGGVFTGRPSFYFVEQIPDLRGALDLAVTQDEVLILYADRHMDRCVQTVETAPSTGSQFRVECETNVSFQDERPGFGESTEIPGAIPILMEYSPPPEPSLYFMDSLSGNLYHYSMRLMFQAQYQPSEAFEEVPSTFALGPPNDLYMAVGSQVYYSQLAR